MLRTMSGELAAAGDIATGALIGRAVESQAGEASHGVHAHSLCLNCGTTLRGDFCYACGQVGHVHRTLASIGHDLLHGVFHFEGKIWRTLPMLFTRPGELTRRYIAGERARFVSPLALFLFSVFLMVATFGSIGGPIGGDRPNSERNGVKAEVKVGLDDELAKARTDEKRLVTERAAILAKSGNADAIDDKLKEVREDIEGMGSAQNILAGKAPVKLSGKAKVNTGIPSLDKRIIAALEEPKLFFYKLQSNAYKYSWALIPISIPFIWLLFLFRRDVGPYDHAIFVIYSLSAMTMGAVGLSVLRAIGLPSGMIMTIFVLGPPLHMYKQLRGAYRIGRFGAIWRTLTLLLFALFAGVIFFIVILGLIA